MSHARDVEAKDNMCAISRHNKPTTIVFGDQVGTYRHSPPHGFVDGVAHDSVGVQISLLRHGW